MQWSLSLSHLIGTVGSANRVSRVVHVSYVLACGIRLVRSVSFGYLGDSSRSLFCGRPNFDSSQGRSPQAPLWDLPPTLGRRVAIPSQELLLLWSLRHAPVMWCDRTCFQLKRKYRNVERYHLCATRLVGCWALRTIRPQSLLSRLSDWPSSLFIYDSVRWCKIHKIIRGSRQIS